MTCPRNAFIVFLLAGCIIPCSAQRPFFNHLRNSTWISSALYGDSAILAAKTIFLYRKETVDETVLDAKSTWIFSKRLLVIDPGDPGNSSERTARLTYLPDRRQQLLKIILDHGDTVVYKVALMSDKHTALLRRKRNHPAFVDR